MGLRVISVNFVLKGDKPRPQGYPAECYTVGDHVRKTRMDRGLSQPDLCKMLRVSVATLANWELNRGQPLDFTLPSIIEFLGYAPYQIQPLLKRINHPIFQYRVLHGIQLKDLAKELGIERGTLRIIERGNHPQREPVKSKIEQFINKIIALNETEKENGLPH